MDNLGQVSGLSHRMHDYLLPVSNFSMKIWQDPGPIFPPLCQGTLDVVEVCYHPRHREVHRVKFAHQALQIFPSNMALCGQDGKHLGQILIFLLKGGLLCRLLC